jgi:uncharacterized protein YhjY with autotransporter beta-barrel domain
MIPLPSSLKTTLASRVSVIALLATAGAVGNVGHVKASCDALYVSSGTITGSHECAIARFVIGDVINEGFIGPTEEGEAGFFVGKGGINGQLVNQGEILGGGYYGGEGGEGGEGHEGYGYGGEGGEGGEGDEGRGWQGALTITTNVSGGVRNEGTIASESGSAIQLGSLGGCYYNVLPAGMTGDIVNAGTIESDYADAFSALYGWMDGTLINEAGGIIRGERGVYISSGFGNWSGGLTNHGTIEGQASAVQIGDDHSACVECSVLVLNEGPGPYFVGKGGDVTFSGGIYNGSDGKYVSRTNAALNIHGQSFSGGITNHGVITQILPEDGYGENDGFGVGILVGSDYFSGGISNTGRIDGLAGNAIWIRDDVYTFEGGITNEGTIQSVATALRVDAGSFYGDIINEGSIRGGNEHAGISVSGNSFTGDISNTGTIEGGYAGVLIDVGSFYGDITNDGVISGGVTSNGIIPVEDPGFSIISASHVGNFINNGTLNAISDALVLDIGNLSGSITNNGLIEAELVGNRAVYLLIDNGASFTNANDAVIRGDVLFGGKNASYAFLAGNGGVEGNLLGVPEGFIGNNDDTISVSGEHYFVSHGGAGTAYAENFASFDVNDGGVAVMGATAIGSSGGDGYDLFAVDALNLNTGGHLYIDNQSTLNVGNFTQADDSILSFYLVEPPTTDGEAGVDFGQIIASGDVTLAGTLQAVVNPLSFSGTNLNEYVYEDVIVGSSLIGDFDATQVAGGSAFYTLSRIIDGSTVDLRMTRNPFSSASCSDNGNRLSQLLEQQFRGGDLSPEEQALFTFLLQLPPGEVCGAFDSIGSSRQADLGALVVETAGPWKSLVNDRVNGLGAVGCNLASSSGSCFNRFAANETGATQVMTDATPGQDPFDWLQTGTRRVGDTASWGRLVGVWGGTDSKAGVGGMDFALTGAIIGVDHVFTETILGGVAMQYTTDDLSFSGSSDDADIDSLEVGAYASFGDTRLYLNINTSFIWHDFNVQRRISDGGAFADYSGTTLSAYMELGRIFETEDMRIQPVLALSFADLDTDAYRETGFALAKLNVDGGAFTSLKSMIGSRFAFPIDLDSGRKVIPEARVVWTHEFADNQSSFLAALQTDPGNKFLVEGREYARDSLVLGAGVTAPISGEASLTLDYDASINPDITTHTLSAGVRVKW